ncbi:hypothetical protein VDG1235_2663 [Verrucomicrobiia bacterium DG1235]|nr:hypothetical protein VDG1235_2663 [Verrucomicrobiae bacterium DG1235]
MKTFLSRKVLVAFLSLVSFLQVSLQAELSDDVVSVLEANIEASGGREALAAIKSSRLKGTFSISAMGMTGTSEIVQAYPDKVYSVQTLPGMGEMIQAFDGEVGWAQDPMQGFRLLSEGEIATLKQNESFADMLDFESAFSGGEVLADADVNGVMATVLKLIDAESGDEQTHYYSKETGLLLRMDMIADMGPMGKVPASMNVKSYGEQDGITYPSLIEMTNAGMLISIGFDSLEVNPEIDDSLFAAPQ